MSSGSTAFPASEGLSTGNPQTGERYQEAPPNAHDNIDSKDQRSHKNTVAAAQLANKEQKKEENDGGLAPTEVAKSVSCMLTVSRLILDIYRGLSIPLLTIGF